MKRPFLIFLSIPILFFIIGCQFYSKPTSFSNQIKNQELFVTEQKQETEEKVSRFLDGVLVEKGEENKIPIAVVLENLPGAPKPTLAEASVIYELPVEGGLTRFLAIFDLENLPENIGPIRSARPYFAEIAEEYKGVFIHAGGSNEVLFKLKEGFYQLFNLDEISWMGKYFYRTDESAPHNLYIKKESIKNFLTDQKISQRAEFKPWLFNEKIEPSGRDKYLADKVEIAFSSLYQIKWQYDSQNNEYQYWQNGRVFKDKEGQELKVKNLIVQLTKISIIDEIGRRKINLTGQGEALIFQNGQVIKGKWLKEAGRTHFFYETGEEITFLAGKTWLGFLSNKNVVNY